MLKYDWTKERHEMGKVLGERQGCCLSQILFNLYRKYITKEPVGGFGNFKMVQQVICAMKYVDKFGLLRQKLCYRV